MLDFAISSLKRHIALLTAVFCLLVGGTFATVKIATDYLLYQNATSTARNWAQYLMESVTDLEQIAAGELPSATSMVFLQSTRTSGQVFRHVIFNRQGFSQLVSDHDHIALVDVSEFSADAAKSVREAKSIVDAHQGSSTGFPSFFA